MLWRSRPLLRSLCLAIVLAKAGRAAPLAPELEWGDTQGSAFSLSLRAGGSQSSDGDREAFGLVTLTLALDRLAQGNRFGAGAHTDDDDVEGVSQASPPTPDGLSPTRVPPRPAAPISRQVVSPSLARTAVDMALRVVGSAAHLERIESMTSRSRTRAALPELGLRAGTSRDASLRLTPIASDPARFTQSGGRDLWFEARLTWKLDRALFSPDEVAIERLTWNTEQARERLVRRVLDLLFEWQDAQLRLVEPLLSDEQYRAAWLSALRSSAELDVLTDGWFSRRLGLT
jgi:hypothetical protein